MQYAHYLNEHNNSIIVIYGQENFDPPDKFYYLYEANDERSR